MQNSGEDEQVSSGREPSPLPSILFWHQGRCSTCDPGNCLSLQLNPDFVEIDLDLKNAHTFSLRDKVEEELESDIIYHYLLEVFKALHGKTVTPPIALRRWTRPSSYQRAHEY